MHATKEQRAQCLGMIKQWRQSGLSQKAFCTDKNIAYHVFHYWYGVYRSQQKAADLFVPLNISLAARPDQIILTGHNGIELKVSFTDQSVGFIKQLLLS